MASNNFAPAFSVQINGAKLRADISMNVTDLSVVNALDTPDTLALTLANPYPKMRWTHTRDADLFKEGSAITVELGYVGNLQPMFDGEITSLSASFPESGTPTLRVQAKTRLHRLQRSAKPRTFQNATDKEMVEAVAQTVGLTPQAEDTRTKHAYVVKRHETDWAFLTERARRIRFEVLVDGKTLIFRKPKESQGQGYVLEWGRTLKSFQPTINAQRQVNQVIVRGYDPKNKKEIIGKAGAGDEEATMGGAQTGAQVADQAFGVPKELVRVDSPIASQEEADQRARAIYNEHAQGFVTGSGASIGLPDIRAGRLIELAGLGPRFSGLYYVTQATHAIGGAGYQTTFEVRRSAIG